MGIGAIRAISLVRDTTKPSQQIELDPYRIAVLYFDDRSEQHEFGYLAEAFTEDLIDVLSQVDALEVIPRSGVRAIPISAASSSIKIATSSIGNSKLVAESTTPSWSRWQQTLFV